MSEYPYRMKFDLDPKLDHRRCLLLAAAKLGLKVEHQDETNFTVEVTTPQEAFNLGVWSSLERAK